MSDCQICTEKLNKRNHKPIKCDLCCGRYILDVLNPEKIFINYCTFIEEFPDDFSGDEIEDYIENPKNANKELMKYIYEMVLFGMVKDKVYYLKISISIKDKIIGYTI